MSTSQATAPTTTNRYRDSYEEAQRLFANESWDAAWDVAKANLGEFNLPVYWQIRNCVVVVKAESSWSTAEVYRRLAEKMWIAARDMASDDEETQAILRFLREELDGAAEVQKMEGADFSDDEESYDDLEHLLQGPDIYIVKILQDTIAEDERLAAEEDSETDDDEDGAQGDEEARGKDRGEDRIEQQGKEGQKDSDGNIEGGDEGGSGSDADIAHERFSGKQRQEEYSVEDGLFDKGDQLGHCSSAKQNGSNMDSAASSPPASEHAESSRGPDGGWRISKWFDIATGIVRRR